MVRRILMSAFISVFAWGCAPVSQVFRTSLLDESSTSEIIVVRESMRVGAAVSLQVYANDTLIGLLGTKAYLRYGMAPGEHVLRLQSKNVSRQFPAYQMMIKLGAGEKACVSVGDTLRWSGLSPRPGMRLKSLDSDACQNEMSKYQNAKFDQGSNRP